MNVNHFLNSFRPAPESGLKTYQLTQDIIQKSFEKAEASFKKILHSSATQIISSPEKLFDNGIAFIQLAEKFTTVEFGIRFILPKVKSF